MGALLLTVQAYEHRRFVRASLRSSPQPWHAPPATLVCVPCKGAELNLAENLRSVLSQDYQNYRVRFVVESPKDAACDVIRQVMASSSVSSELIVAGQCTDSGQKVHNLLFATQDVPDDVEVLAFFDSDAQPAPMALSRLVSCAGRNDWDVATGYRWCVPKRLTPANLTLASINAAVVCLFKRRGWNLIWGGAWAVSRELFERSGVRDAWRGTLSDDLVASRVLRRAGATVIFEPGAVASSSIDVGWRGAASFLRRQFVIGRCYAPGWWWSTIPLMLVHPVVLWGGGALALLWTLRGNPMAVYPLFVSGTLYALSLLRAWWRQTVWSQQFSAAAAIKRATARFDYWASPLSCLFAASVMLASAAGRSINWRGISYYIGHAGRITLLGRVPTEADCKSIRSANARRHDRDLAARATSKLRFGEVAAATKRSTYTDANAIAPIASVARDAASAAF